MLLIVILSIAASALYYVYVYRPNAVELVELAEQAEKRQTERGFA